MNYRVRQCACTLKLKAIEEFIRTSVIQVFDTIGLMADNMSGTLASLTIDTNLCEVDISLLNATNALVLIALIPLLDLLVVPMLRHAFLNPSITCRLGIGSLLAFVAAFSIFMIHLEGDLSLPLCIFTNVLPLKMDIDVYWILLPTLLLTVAEVFIYIPGESREVLA